MNIKKTIILLIFIFFKNISAMPVMTESISLPTIKKQKKQRFMKNSTSAEHSFPLKIIIGSGGSGEISTTSINSSFVTKTSYSYGRNMLISKEYEILTEIYNCFNRYSQEFEPNLINNIKIPEPISLEELSNENEEEGNKTIIKMERFFPVEKNQEISTQIYLGKNNYDLIQRHDSINIIKGHNLGYIETKKLLTKYNPFTSPFKKKFKRKLSSMASLYYNLGSIMAIIHFYAQYDGLDIEICLTRESINSKELKIGVIDFNFCNQISKYLNNNRQKAIDKIIIAMNNEPFFPNPDQKEFKYFRDAYIMIAKNLEFMEIAENIIDEFIKEQFIRKILIVKYLMEYQKINSRAKKTIEKKSLTLKELYGETLLAYIKKNDYFIKTKKTFKFLIKLLK